MGDYQYDFTDNNDDGSDPEHETPEVRPTKKQTTSRGRSGPREPRKPRTWTEKDEYGELVALSDEQRVKLRERALNFCLWHLGQGPRTQKQLTDAMTKKGVPEDLQTSIMGTLSEYNYVNDTAFAENFVRSRHEGGARKGASAIRYELRTKGVDDETVAQALEQITPESEEANARHLLERKIPSTRRLDRNKATARLVGMLARKGYSPGLAYGLVREMLVADALEQAADEDDLGD